MKESLDGEDLVSTVLLIPLALKFVGFYLLALRNVRTSMISTLIYVSRLVQDFYWMEATIIQNSFAETRFTTSTQVLLKLLS